MVAEADESAAAAEEAAKANEVAAVGLRVQPSPMTVDVAEAAAAAEASEAAEADFVEAAA